jgi:glycosyltransferase involved in cell wall biosynthesis
VRILALHPRGVACGGGDLVATWMLEALKDEHQLSVLAWEPLDLAALNRFCGTTLQAQDLTLITPRARLRAAIALSEGVGVRSHPVHRYQLLMREARRLAAGAELLLSAFDEADLGPPGIQYVHSPWSQIAMGAVPVCTHGRAARLRPWVLASGFSVERMRANVTLTNSRWTAEKIERALAIPARVVDPPVPGEFRPLPWERREHAVAVVARLVPEKQIELAIEAVRLLRLGGEELRLHVIGNARDRARPEYQVALRRRIAGEPWIELHEDLPRPELIGLLCRCRYGLHPMPDEPFGIAVAELVRAGCVPLTRRSGGVVEIVPDERLHFDSPAEAAARLRDLIASRELCEELRGTLRRRAEALAPERFVAQIRALVGEHERRQREGSSAEGAAARQGG